MKKTNRKGFTIVELVIVIAVIAILAAVLIPTFAGMINKANDSKALQNATNVLKAYIADNAATDEDVDLYILVDTTYFEVTDGKLNKDPLDPAPTVTGLGTTTYQGCTVYVKN